MQQPSFDPGLTQRFQARLRRTIEKDGKFNVRRRGATWRDFHPYLYLTNMRWPAFIGVVLASFLAVNGLFALAYFALGPGHLDGAGAPTRLGRYWNTFFFSSHTLTTVGYGNITPRGMAANILSSFEAMLGVVGFAVGAGLLYGRFSRPTARIGFSPNSVVAPYQDGSSLQFRLVNQRPNTLMELEAVVMLMTVEGGPAELKRRYQLLALERPKIYFMPLTWTVVHPIDGDSPLHGLGPQDLERLQAEVLILLKAHDDTFSQTVYARYSYRYDEIVWAARFVPPFQIDAAGDMVLDVDRVGEYAPVNQDAG